MLTNGRIAEFKFSKWQDIGSNGARKRQVFMDYVNLLLNKDETKKKELYVFGADRVREYFQSEKASWQKVLSKSGGLEFELRKYLVGQNVQGLTLKSVCSIQNIAVIDIETILL